MRRTGSVMSTPTVRRSSAAVLGALLAVGGTALTAPASAAPPEKTAVIVQLTPGSDAAAEARRAAANGGGSVSFVYTAVFRGFAGEFTAQTISALERNPRVSQIEADGRAVVSGSQAITDSGLWGLDRIDDRSGLDGSYDYREPTVSNVTAYIVDTGVAPHPDLDQWRGGYDAFTKSTAATAGTADCNGHGTHVAGTVAGTTFGVAKDAAVVPVKVLDCAGSGSWSGVIAGLEWVVVDHPAGAPAVANMSLGGPRNSSVDLAVQKVIADGVTVAVAAGNDGRDACSFSPARVTAAITTGATNRADERASFSNYGPCLDLFAPGVDVKSAWINQTYSAESTRTISGTSMATPHVAGAAAALLEQNPGLSPEAVANALVSGATRDVVLNPRKGSPNRLLFQGS